VSPNFAAGAVISVFALVRFASAPVAGRLVNRIGERVVLATGIGIVGVSSLVAGLSGSYAQLLVLRGLGGLGSAMFTVSSFALLLRVVRPRPARPGCGHLPERLPAGRHRWSRLRRPADGVVRARGRSSCTPPPCWSPGVWPRCSSPARHCARASWRGT
jgi:hypothetical protein